MTVPQTKYTLAIEINHITWIQDRTGDTHAVNSRICGPVNSLNIWPSQESSMFVVYIHGLSPTETTEVCSVICSADVHFFFFSYAFHEP